LEEIEKQPQVPEPSGGEQGSPAFCVDPFADAIPETVFRLLDRVVPDEEVPREDLQPSDLPLEPGSDVLVHPGMGREQTDHDRLAAHFMNGVAQEARIPFVQDVHDAIAVNGTPALADLAAAGGTGLDFFCDGLAACGTEFHEGLLSNRRGDARFGSIIILP